MGYITNVLKGSLNSSMNQIKSYDIAGQVKSGLSAAGVELPKVEIPESVKSIKPNIDTSRLRLPMGVDSYISPLLNGVLSQVEIPNEINGVPLPKLPDLSSVSSDIDSYVSGMGIDTEKLGIRNVSDILKEPDLASLKNVEFASPVDLNNMPDLTKSLDGVSFDEIDGSFNEIKSQIPSTDQVDISKYF